MAKRRRMAVGVAAGVAKHAPAAYRIVKAFAKSRTRAATKTKHHKKRPRKVIGDGGSTSSWFKYTRKGPKSAKGRDFGTMISRDSRSTLSNSNAAQHFAGCTLWWAFDTLNTLLQELWSLVPTIQEGSNAATSSLNQMKSYVMSVEGKVVFANECNVNVTVDIYDIHAKKTGVGLPTDDWFYGDTLEENDSSAGTAVTFASNFGGGRPFQYGTRPSFSKRFKTRWGVDKKITVIIKPGEQHIHNFVFAPHKLISTAEIEQQWFSSTGASWAPGVSGSVQGITRGLMWVQSGSPYIDKGTGGSGGVSITASELAIVSNSNYRHSIAKLPNTAIHQWNGISAGSGTLAAIVNEMTDAVTGYSAA